MCTAGVIRLGQNDYLLFKNKDFGRPRFNDRLVIERDIFGVAGVSTWADNDPDVDEFSGISVGANSSGVLACDTNVSASNGHSNYDELVEVALRQGTDVATAVNAVRSAVENRPYMWGNLMLIDSEQQVAIEVRSNEVAVETLSGPAARANHHLALGDASHHDDTSTSLQRLVAAEKYIATATTIDDVLALLRSHDEGETGVCNHSARETVYSYVLRRVDGKTTLLVSQGKPCTVSRYDVLDLPIGATWSAEAVVRFRTAYPSEQAFAGLV